MYRGVTIPCPMTPHSVVTFLFGDQRDSSVLKRCQARSLFFSQGLASPTSLSVLGALSQREEGREDGEIINSREIHFTFPSPSPFSSFVCLFPFGLLPPSRPVHPLPFLLWSGFFFLPPPATEKEGSSSAVSATVVWSFFASHCHCIAIALVVCAD